MPEPLKQKLRLEADQAIRGYNAATGALRDYVSKQETAVGGAGSLMGKIKQIGTSATTWIAGTAVVAFAALTGAIAKATSKAVGFENQLNEVRKTAGLSERGFDRLRRELLDIQAELGVAQEDLAGIAGEAGRLGIEAPADIARFTRTVALMSEATVASADEAAQGLARALNAFNLSIDRAEDFASVLNTLSNQTVANAGDLVDVSRRIGASGQQLGIAAEDAAALGATLVDSGFRVEQAGTRMRFIFTRIMSQAEEVGEVMDMTGSQIIEAFDERGTAALREFLAVLGQMEQAEQARTIADIFGDRDVQTLQTLVNNTEDLETNLGAARDQMQEGTSLMREMNITLKDVSNEWNRLTGRLSAWITDFGSNFTGVLESALSSINDMLGGVDELRNDLTDIRRRRTRLLRTQDLIDDLQEAERGTAEFDDTLSQLESRIPQTFIEFNEQGEAVGVQLQALQRFMGDLTDSVEEEMGEKQTEIFQALNREVAALNRNQSRLSVFDPGTDRWQEAKDAVDENRQSVRTLVEAISQDLPVAADEARKALEDRLEGMDLQSFIGSDNIAQDPTQLFPFLPPPEDRQNRGGAVSDAVLEGEQLERARQAGGQLRQVLDQVLRIQRRRRTLSDEEARKLDEIAETEDRINKLVSRKRDLETEVGTATGEQADQLREVIQQTEAAIREERVRLDILEQEREAARELVPEEAQQIEIAPQIEGDGLDDLLDSLTIGPTDAQAELETLNSLTEQYRNTIRDLRLDLQRGEISQREFQQAAQEAARGTRQQVEEIVEKMEEWGLITEEVKDAALEAFEETADEAEETKEEVQGVGESIQDASRLVRGIGDIASQFGEVSDKARDAINSTATLLDNVGRLVELANEADGFSNIFSSFSTAISGGSAILGAVGGVASLLSSTFSGPDRTGEEIRELNRKIDEQINAIRENTEALIRQRVVGEDVSGEQVQDALSIVEEIQGRIGFRENPGRGGGENFFEGGPERARDFLSSLEDTGIEAFDGILEAFNDKLEAGESPAQAIRGILNSIQPAINELEDAFGDFGDSVQGLAEELQAREEFGGAGDDELLEVLMEALQTEGGDGRRGRGGDDSTSRLPFSDDLVDAIRTRLDEVDLSDPEAVEDFIDTLSEFLFEQDPSALGLDGSFEDLLGEGTPGDLRDFMELLRDQLGGERQDGPEETRRRATQIRRTITEIQANQLIAIETEQLFILRQMLEEMGGELDESAFDPVAVGGPVELKVDQEIKDIRAAVLEMADGIQPSDEGGNKGGDEEDKGRDRPDRPVEPPIEPPTLPSPGDRDRDRDRSRGTTQIQVDIQAQETPESISEKIDEALRQSKLSRLGG